MSKRKSRHEPKSEVGKLEYFFITTGFHDLFPRAVELAGQQNYSEVEMIDAVCKVFDKSRQHPPIRNRSAWFMTVFAEKLAEARSEILATKALQKRLAQYDAASD